MDHQSLVPIAQRAILQVLNYNFLSAKNGCGLPALDQQTRNMISSDIQKNLPLAAHAEDIQKAYLEIVCDAALPVAEKYKINKRWFYTAVQGITSMELVPTLYENVVDPIRLGISDVQDDNGIASFEDEEMDHDEEDGAQPHDPAANVAAAPKNGRRFWQDTEIRTLIDLHVTGQTLRAVADHLGRSFSSVQSQWRKASRPESAYKDYLQDKLNAVAAENRKEGEQASESDDTYDSEVDEGEAAGEADEQAQLPDQATSAVTTAADASGVPNPARPWTDADIQELIRHRIGGMSSQVAAKCMLRPRNSVHCMWLNVMNNTGGRWFKYIHKQFRAQKKKQKRAEAEATQGAMGADADATVESGSTPLLGKRKRAPSSVASEASEVTEATEANMSTNEGNGAPLPMSELS